MPLLQLILSVLGLLLLLGTLAVIVWSFFNAPYAPSVKNRLDAMLELLDIGPNDKAVDLGSGDGRVVIALAQAGAKEVHGYEINPWLVLWSRYTIRRAGLQKKAFVHWKSMWNADIHDFNVVALYILDRVMPSLENKLANELPSPAKVVSNAFHFPTWKPVKKKDNVSLYLFSK